MINKTKLSAIFNSKILLAVVFVAGLMSGSETLDSVESSRPPMTWQAVGILFLFGIFAMCFVLGIQILIKNSKGLKYGWKGFYIISFYLMGSGIGATAVAITRNSFGPAAVVFISVAAGIGVGLLILKSSLEVIAPKNGNK
ncbi:hypothetical protein DOM22_06565 [Bdellovibrio sp. ZAP7]|uniref:hypothetical protein n=1 Tax=Bdellovibrio sp. ZAP7 TaxID=2231053 RepID=UPI0011588109|nr:hypothetical protein [Bdellovibrio sp. ZAP7]QDK44848.1 hypothetical protein DOM22_06565 [Bdellovibrio sp. ZAP7]